MFRVVRNTGVVKPTPGSGGPGSAQAPREAPEAGLEESDNGLRTPDPSDALRLCSTVTMISLDADCNVSHRGRREANSMSDSGSISML